jgi:hypothetical protein
MSRITPTVISAWTSRDRATLNTNFSAIETGSTALDAYNFAEEGLDWRVFATNAPWNRLSLVTETTRALLAPTGGVFTQYAPNGTAFRTAVGLTTVATGEAVRIITAIYFRTTPAGGLGIDRNTNLFFQHVYNDGGATNVIAGSNRQYKIANPALTTDLHGTVIFESWIKGTTPATVVNWVETQYLLTGATAIAHPQSSIQVVSKATPINWTEV